MPGKLHLLQAPDIRMSTILSFLCTLGSNYPLIFGHVDVTDRESGHMWLHECLLVPPGGRVEIYKDLCRHYQIPPCQFTCHKLARADHTIRDLHRQLWHEANQANYAMRRYQE